MTIILRETLDRWQDAVDAYRDGVPVREIIERYELSSRAWFYALLDDWDVPRDREKDSAPNKCASCGILCEGELCPMCERELAIRPYEDTTEEILEMI